MPLLWSSQKFYTAFNPLPPHSTCIHLVLQGSREASFPSCCRLTLAGHLVLPDQSYHSSSQQNKRQKISWEKKIMGQNKGSLIKQKTTKALLPASHWQACPATSQEVGLQYSEQLLQSTNVTVSGTELHRETANFLNISVSFHTGLETDKCLSLTGARYAKTGTSQLC